MDFRNEWEQKHSHRDHELYSLRLSVLFSLLKMLLFQKNIPKKKYYCWIWDLFSTLTQCWREWRNAELLFAASSSNHTHWSSRFFVLKLYNEGLSFFFLFIFYPSILFLFFFFLELSLSLFFGRSQEQIFGFSKLFVDVWANFSHFQKSSGSNLHWTDLNFTLQEKNMNRI